MLSSRRQAVLAALVEEYVSTGQPVGSKALVERYALRCSPATVRSELCGLEEAGYLWQPHVSAGRIPTDVGYRAFVDAYQDAIPTAGLSAGEVERRPEAAPQSGSVL